ncbi:MAG: type II secretion system protein [Planctomycetota bacterium]|nr:type II secretion system protein [Planctomycetota bacterium]MDA1113556.1 type II secretion system protein [Planctomycetota bacterium]
MKTNRKSGFTIIEMLIVVTILAMLAGILIPVLEDAAKSSRDSRRASDLKTMQTALASYNRVNGAYPDTNGAWWGDASGVGTNHGYGVTGSYCPGLVPDFMPALPKDPSADLPDATNGYQYQSDGIDYKFSAKGGPETFPTGNPFYDSQNPTTVWSISTPGGYNYVN